MSASPHHCTDITRVFVNLHATLWEKVTVQQQTTEKLRQRKDRDISHLVGSKMEGSKTIPGQTGWAEAF